MLGVLEETPGGYAGAPYHSNVRVVFYKDGADWKAFPSDCSDEECLHSLAAQYPRQVQWTIAFDGRAIGQVMGQTPDGFAAYSTVGQQQITSNDVPAVGKRSAVYGGFLGQPVYRPLVAVSQPNVDDPEVWKRAETRPYLTSAVRKSFRTQFPHVTNCSKNQPDTPGPWHYEDEDIHVKTAYASAKGWSLVEILLGSNFCDGPPEEAFVGQWFLIAPTHDIRYLGGNMWLVDAGDYDHDGKSELLFALDGYDEGGYRLFYADFQKQVSFEFAYH